MVPVIYLMRHGITDANRDRVIAGNFESKLLPEGFEQSRQAGMFLGDKTITKIFCSPRNRTRQTLEVMKLGSLPTEFDERLAEINCGIYEGIHSSLLPPEFSFESICRNQDVQHPQGESITQVRSRIRLFLNEKIIGNRNPLLIVAHGGSGACLLMELLPKHQDEFVRGTKGNKDFIDNGEIWKIENGGYERVFSPDKRKP